MTEVLQCAEPMSFTAFPNPNISRYICKTEQETVRLEMRERPGTKWVAELTLMWRNWKEFLPQNFELEPEPSELHAGREKAEDWVSAVLSVCGVNEYLSSRLFQAFFSDEDLFIYRAGLCTLNVSHDELGWYDENKLKGVMLR